MSNNSMKKQANELRKHRAAGFMLATLPLVLALASCNSLQKQAAQPSAAKPKMDASFTPLREPKLILPVEVPHKDRVSEKAQIKSGPGVTIGRQIADTQTKQLDVNISGSPVSANYHDMPLPAFINEVFGEQLGQSFSLDPQIEKQEDLVTLRLAEPIPPAELFHVAVRTLSSYGIAVSQEGNLLSFTIDGNVNSGETPLLVSGRALPDVPASHRPVFMFVPLKAVSGGKVVSWLKDAMKGKDLEVQEDSLRNAVMLKGKQDLVEQALSIIEVLDQPLMRGKFSASIEPAFVKVADLSKNLESVLNAEGYDAKIRSSSGSIILIPLDGTNQMVVFAASQQVLDHVREWINTLDRRQQMSIDQGIFSYEVRNADATHIVNILNGIENGTPGVGSGAARSTKSSGSAVSDTTNTSPSNANASASTTAAKVGGGNFVVDSNRNTLIFKGSGQAWADLLPVIQSLDKSAPSVLIEVLIAEVTLNDTFNAGVEFFSKGKVTNNGNAYTGNFATLGGLGIKQISDTAGKAAKVASGFTAEALNSAGETRAILNLFQQNKRAEIRSRPRIMVKSGQLATIDVGTDVPTRGNTTTSSTGVSLQSVDTARTGLRLSVQPVVHASGNVDIAIDQSLSEASINDTSNIDSPTIFNRQIKTTVTLQDGGSILLGGLISDKVDKTDGGVPWASKIPLLGNLFKAKKNGSQRTELMVMIIPYVVDTPAEGQAITKTIQDAFQKAE